MMQDVTRGAASGLAAARCGANLSGDRAARVAAMLATTAALPEAQRFTDRMRDQLLQSCPDDAALTRINAAVEPARTFVAADRARGAGTLFTSSVKALVAHAITEGWTTASYAALHDLVALDVVRRSFCASYTTDAERSVCVDPNFSSFTTARGELLDPALAARQAGFAHALLPARQSWLGTDEFLDVQLTIDVQFFDRGLWVGCTDQGFAASQATLFQKLEQLRTAAPDDQLDLEDAIDAQIQATTCP